jgi:prophage antirepressor-like protein
MAVKPLDADEKGLRIAYTPGGPQEVGIINESGLYHLILKSRVPAAKRFRKWVTGDLLPTLRKTGSYTLPSAQPESLLTTEGRSVFGGITKRVVASQIRPLLRQQQIDQANIIALKREIAAIKEAPIADRSVRRVDRD